MPELWQAVNDGYHHALALEELRKVLQIGAITRPLGLTWRRGLGGAPGTGNRHGLGSILQGLAMIATPLDGGSRPRDYSAPPRRCASLWAPAVAADPTARRC